MFKSIGMACFSGNLVCVCVCIICMELNKNEEIMKLLILLRNKLTHVPLGYSPLRASLRGEGLSPLSYFRTVGNRKTEKTAFESSQ